MSPLRLAWLDLSRKRVATGIAVVSIALAVACAGVLVKLFFLSNARFATLASEGQALVGAKSGAIEILLGAENLEGEFPNFVPYKLFESIYAKRPVHFEDGANAGSEGVEAVIPFLYFGNYDGYRVIGTSEDFLKRPRHGADLEVSTTPELASGRWVADAAPEVVVGSDVAARSRLTEGASLTVHDASSTNLSREFRVVGILKPTEKIWDSALFSSLKAGQLFVAASPSGRKTIWGSEVLHYFMIYMRPQAYAPMKSLINERTVAQIVFVPEARAQLENLTGTGRNFGLLLMALVLFLGGSSVATLMITRFEAMSVQIAVLRALGYARAQLAAWLLCEGLMLGAAACLIGGAIDALVFPVARHAAQLDLMVSHGNFLLQTLIVWFAALIATVLAVIVPLVRVSRQDVHVSLRG